ncbi:MAG: hypothetical protein EZS28_021924 [Streblomastix strix]|uniref:Uncharacterized protein n=1 Tax=Streblomastix strix TaxID=222440 RepID=A0A5J4VIW8_9EUKA|nr:MAG: hypothetical protein EZS28_021924 [Streblomastix strix]
MSPRQSVPIIPAIVEVDSPFQKEQDKVSVQSVRSRRKSSIFEEIIVPDLSICRWLLDKISEDEHMTKESAHLILFELQLIRVIAHTFEIVENQVILNSEDEECCGKFTHVGIRTFSDIKINNVNILPSDTVKVNLLRVSSKICLQKVRKITSILDLGDISSKLMSAATNEIFDIKADKADTYSKTETNNLLNNKADSGVSYTKGEDNALLLLKAGKTQLIDAYIKGETNNLLNNKINSGVSYTKGEDNALLFLKSNQSIIYTKIETEYLISQIEVGDVNLSGYMKLGTAQTITANKTFNNACRFVSSIDGMITIIIASFAKLGADSTVVLLGVGGTKPISEFTTAIDDSNYVKKNGDVQDMQGIFRKTTLDQPYPEPTDNDYIALGAVKSEFASFIYSESINDNLTAAQFIKSYSTDQLVLLANGTTKQISEFVGTPTNLSYYYTNTQIYNKTETENKYVRLDYLIQQTITRRLKYLSPFGGTYDETQDPVENTYLTQSETFNANVNATGFLKSGKDDASVQLADGGDALISSFGGLTLESIT